MPRKLRLKRRGSSWTAEHRKILMSGLDYFDLFTDETEQAACWRELKTEILPEFIAVNPGSRPWAWWEFDMPVGSRREAISGRHPWDDPEFRLPKELWFGEPRFLRECDLSIEYETEASFLERLNLLFGCELKCLLNGV